MADELAVQGAIKSRQMELSSLVAEKVMGIDPVCKGPLRRFEKREFSPYYYFRCRECGAELTITTEYFAQAGLPESHHRNYPAYAEDMNAAWQVVRQVTAMPDTFDLAVQQRVSRFAFWWEKANLWAGSAGDTAQAICEKALELMEIVGL